MNNYPSRYLEQKRQDEREADLVQNRSGELRECPLFGAFDAGHLQLIHWHIYQDV